LLEASLERQFGELAVMQLLREAKIYFTADEMLMRKVMVEGAIMIEAVVRGERWEIMFWRTARSRWSASGRKGGLHDFDAKALHELLAITG
jgi:hypothetical protein